LNFCLFLAWPTYLGTGVVLPGIFLYSIITCLCAFAFDSFLGVEDLVGQHIINRKSGKSN
ncbi:MAG: hypothetical protein PWK00_01870, partial [Coxiella burnetii]|nr:hypothetical protein [Coxiella burnetii]